MASRLETIPGVGPKKRKALLKAFDNSIDAIRSASVEALTAVQGINDQLAETIKEML
jgi:excinuclease ABC subunit C